MISLAMQDGYMYPEASFLAENVNRSMHEICGAPQNGVMLMTRAGIFLGWRVFLVLLWVERNRMNSSTNRLG
jgi:hypothetical protein